VTGSFIIVAFIVDSLLDVFNFSSVIGTTVSSAFLPRLFAVVGAGGESPKNLDFAYFYTVLISSNLATSKPEHMPSVAKNSTSSNTDGYESSKWKMRISGKRVLI
jgi:hypothetical protein